MRWRTAAAIALPVAFLGYFFVYPLVSILLTGLDPANAGSAFSAVLTDPVLTPVFIPLTRVVGASASG